MVFKIKEITRETALDMVRKFHYSNMLPSVNKIFLGAFLDHDLVGVVTLGWGTRPKHTIKAIFPSLDTKDYFEIGRMCMDDKMARNSESRMLSKVMKWIKAHRKEVKVVFTWADGMLGKPGYVYQASNFFYAGFIWTDMYLKDGIKIHPRQMRALLSPSDKRITVRPTLEQMEQFDIKHYKGKQFKYLYFVCDKREKKRLLNESLVPINIEYPKHKNLEWKIKQGNRKWIPSEMPAYKSDTLIKDIKEKFDLSG